jgi:unsaturated chondroitin disaccharide hydrolase
MLSAAEEVANWWVANLPADGIPYSNSEPADPATEPVDSSAAAIAASGLIELAHLVRDPALRASYLASARTSLTTLTSPAYLSSGTDNAAVLLHGTDNVGAGIVDTGLSYGDYYLLEGLLRLDPNLGRQAARTAIR